MRPLTMMQAQYKPETQTGESIHIDNCKGGYFSVTDDYGLKVEGDTFQQTYEGKNLFDAENFTINTDTAILLSKCKNGFVAKMNPSAENIKAGAGTYSSGWAGTTTTFPCPLPQEYGHNTYTVSFDITYSDPVGITELADTPQIYFCGTYIWSNSDGIPEIGVKKHFKATVTGDLSNNGFYISCNSCTITVENIMIEIGDAETTYEPYVGGIPSPNPDYPQDIQCVKAGTKVKVCGKNLLTAQKVYQNAAFYREEILDGRTCVSFYDSSLHKVPFYGKENTRYTVSFDAKVRSESLSTAGDGHYIAIFYTDGTYNYKTFSTVPIGESTEWNRIVFTSTENKTIEAIGLVSYHYVNRIYIDTDTFQFEENNTATTYEPCISGGELTTPCDLYEGDIWYPMTGKVERYVIYSEFDGTENWEYSSNFNSYYVQLGTTSNTNAYCTHFPINYNKWITGDDDVIHLSYSYAQYFRHSRCETLSDWKAWLAEQYNNGTPVTLVCTLYSGEKVATEHYDLQPCFMPQGTVNIYQEPVELSAELTATAMVRR